MTTDSPSDGKSSWKLWLGLLIAVTLVVLGVVGWIAIDAGNKSRNAAREAARVGELHEKLATKAIPLTDEEFDELLALCDTADPEARFVALMTATAQATRHRPEWKSRVLPVADRLAEDPDPTVRRKAERCQASLRKSD